MLGVRAWHTDQTGRLFSTFVDRPWEPGVNEAACHWSGLAESDPGPHLAPDADCDCGIYALHDFNHRYYSWLRNKRLVIGAIGAWGVMEVHSTGFRAQFARILALGRTFMPSEELDRASRWYDVPLVPVENLEEFGLRSAQPISDAMAPQPTPVTILVDCQAPDRLVSIEAMRRGVAFLASRLQGMHTRVQIVTCGRQIRYAPVEAGESELDDYLELLTATGERSVLERGIRSVRATALLWEGESQPTAILLLGARPARLDLLLAEIEAAEAEGTRVIVLVPQAEFDLIEVLGRHVRTIDPDDYIAGVARLIRALETQIGGHAGERVDRVHAHGL